uniref:Ig-like domain-containing protein n=1 Tax=Electrophorus electricus TaxID=8005 RepID=A0AAY5EQJ0_ELEEL
TKTLARTQKEFKNSSVKVHKGCSHTVFQGDNVTLSCNYKEFSGTIENLHWYQQYPQSKPEFLLYIFPSGTKSEPLPPRLSANSVKRLDLKISSAAVSDSALYYCALQPTVTGNPATLYKNLCE